ncbi:hypothetical protein GCM10020229_64790 [Kitasatospora albolonga]|uniref:MBL fold metallo-hydrolase n=1 Tax=Kitasatospora albolonga TaxID=68173 RepID=UPI0031EDD98F
MTTDAPAGRSASFTVLTTGYTLSTGPGVAATVSYVTDGGRHVVVDPGMVAHRDRILGPLAELGLTADQVTDVVLSHHHPDNTMNVGLFGERGRPRPQGRVPGPTSGPTGTPHGHELTPLPAPDRDPGHSPEDITLLAGTRTAWWPSSATSAWRPNGPVEDPVSPDQAVLRASRERVLAVADLIVPGHGAPFRAVDALL